jgi:hypothetical protein
MTKPTDDTTLYVPMRQFFRPNGESKKGQLMIPGARTPARLSQLEWIANENIEFTIEVLNGGMVNLCMDDGEFDFAYAVVTPANVNIKVLVFIDTFSVEDYRRAAAVIHG